MADRAWFGRRRVFAFHHFDLRADGMRASELRACGCGRMAIDGTAIRLLQSMTPHAAAASIGFVLASRRLERRGGLMHFAQ